MNEAQIINNQYQILEKIGVGGFATVYKAWDNMLQKFVAIKKIHPEYSSNAKYVDMFRQEAVNTAKLEHENIVRVVNFIRDEEGSFYMVMDYVKGVDLEYFIEKCRRNSISIPSELVLYIIQEVLKALDYAHSAKDGVDDKPLHMIHRDVSPGNVMLYFDGRVKLTDFGIAKAGQEQDKQTEKSKLKGKISYMSPEQATGEPLDSRSDLFSLGLVLYETLTNEKAFTGESDVDVWQKVKGASIDFKKLKDSDIPEEVQNILKKMLEKQQEKRYQNAAEIYIDVRRYLVARANSEDLIREYQGFIRDMLHREITALRKEKTDYVDGELDAEGGLPIQEPSVVQEGTPKVEQENKSAQLEPLGAEETSSVEVPLGYLGEDDLPETETIGLDGESNSEEGVQEQLIESDDKVAEGVGAAPTEEIAGTVQKEIPQETVKKEPVPELSKPKIEEDGELTIEPVSYTPTKKQAPAKKPDKEVKPKPVEKPKPSKPKFIKPQAPPPSSSQKSAGPADYMEHLSDDKEKTVIDFVLDTAKKYKKVFISSVIALVIAFVNFTLLDTYLQFTNYGLKIHNLLWPPALQLDTDPSNAQVSLYKDDVDIIEKEGYRAVTPTYISKIAPGLYTLTLSKQGFGTVTRRVTVFGRAEQDQDIAIAGSKMLNGVYVVPFEVGFEIDSNPKGADLFIDGKKISETPFSGSLEIGKHNFVLTQKGFETLGKSDLSIGYNPDDVRYSLGICMLDSSKAANEQTTVDYRFWDIKESRTSDDGRKFIIKGTLWKKVNVDSVPQGATVTMNNSSESIGVTPLNNIILPAGNHSVKIDKKGYIPWTGGLKVTSDSKNKLSTILKKIIKVSAYRAGASPKKDIGAKLSIKGTTFSGTTPMKVTLEHGSYTFKLSKGPSYKPKTVTYDIGKLGDTLRIKMQLRPPHLQVKVVDYLSGKIVKNAMVWIGGSYWRRTNSKGIASDYILKPSGEFNIEVKADKYDDVKSSIKIYRGQRKKLTVKIGVPKDGKIIVDIPDEFMGTSVYMDGEYIGEDSQVIKDVTRAEHEIEFKFNDINKSIIKKLDVMGLNQVIILKPVMDGTKIKIVQEKPPFIDLIVKDFTTGTPIENATIMINGVLWERTDKTGVIKQYLEDYEGELLVEVKTDTYETFKSIVVINKNEQIKLVARLGAPKDGTIVLDIPDEFTGVNVYLDGEYLGEHLSMISDIARSEHSVEVRSEFITEKVIKKISFEKPNQLIMLRLVKDNGKSYLKELSPDAYWKQ